MSSELKESCLEVVRNMTGDDEHDARLVESLVWTIRHEVLNQAAELVICAPVPRTLRGISTEGALYVGIADRDDEIAQRIRNLQSPNPAPRAITICSWHPIMSDEACATCNAIRKIKPAPSVAHFNGA